MKFSLPKMAKWGEGDPRWIVEDRPDATNVNNWHWKEKDATAWSKEQLLSLLSGIKIEDKVNNLLEVEEVTFGDDCEAVINNRKQKLIFLYEFHITLKCTGYTSENDKITGKIDIPNLEQQEPLEDVSIDYSQEEPKSTNLQYYDFFKSQVRPFIRERLGVYIEMLKNEYSRGLVLPTVGKQNKMEVSQNSAEKGDINGTIRSNNSSSTQSKNSGLKISTFKIQLEEVFQANAHDVIEAFLDKPRVEAFTGTAAQVDRTKGGAFALYGNNITGFFDCIEEKKLKMRWRKKDWPTEHYSVVDIELIEKPEAGETRLKLNQSLIPSEKANESDMINGWKGMFFQPMKQRLALGYLL